MRSAILVALLALAAPAAAQLTSFAGPAKAPLGCPVVLGFSNDTSQAFQHGVCPWRVDGPGGFTFVPNCIQIVVTTEAGGTWSALWHQSDDFGNPAPPGTYQITIFEPDGTQGVHKVQLGDFDAALTVTGVPKVGKTRGLRLCAPGDGGLLYAMVASLSATTGIPTCAGTFPLDPDLLLSLSLATPSVFAGWSGTLDPDGESDDPLLAVPPNPALAGLGFQAAFATLDPLSPCPVVSISEPAAIAIH